MSMYYFRLTPIAWLLTAYTTIVHPSYAKADRYDHTAAYMQAMTLQLPCGYLNRAWTKPSVKSVVPTGGATVSTVYSSTHSSNNVS